MIEMTTYAKNRFLKDHYYYGVIEYNIPVAYYQNQANLAYEILFTKNTITSGDLLRYMWSYYLYADPDSKAIIGYSPVLDNDKYCIGTILTYEPAIMMDEEANFTKIGNDVKIFVEHFKGYGGVNNFDKLKADAIHRINHKGDVTESHIRSIIEAIDRGDYSEFGLDRYILNNAYEAKWSLKYCCPMTQYEFSKFLKDYFGRGWIIGIRSVLILDFDDNMNVSSSEKPGRINCNFAWVDTNGVIYHNGKGFNNCGVRFKVDDDVNVSDDCSISIDDYNRLREYYKNRFPNK